MMNAIQENPYKSAKGRTAAVASQAKSPKSLLIMGIALPVFGFTWILFGALLPRLANPEAPVGLLGFAVACLYIGGVAFAVLDAIAISASVWLNRVREMSLRSVAGWVDMPIYEYECEACCQHVELLIRANENPQCPVCGSHKLNKQFSVPAAHNSSDNSSLSTMPIGGG